MRCCILGRKIGLFEPFIKGLLRCNLKLVKIEPRGYGKQEPFAQFHFLLFFFPRTVLRFCLLLNLWRCCMSWTAEQTDQLNSQLSQISLSLESDARMCMRQLTLFPILSCLPGCPHTLYVLRYHFQRKHDYLMCFRLKLVFSFLFNWNTKEKISLNPRHTQAHQNEIRGTRDRQWGNIQREGQINLREITILQ